MLIGCRQRDHDFWPAQVGMNPVALTEDVKRVGPCVARTGFATEAWFYGRH